jgi:hypothetical protein
MKCESHASFLAPTPLQALAYVTSPRSKLQRSPSLEEEVNVLIDIYNLFPQCNCFHLDPWPLIVDFYNKTLLQVNLGVPKFPTFFQQV